MKKTLICMSLALLGTQALANDAGWYVGGDISSTKFKFDGLKLTETGVGFYGGYRFNQHLAVEGVIRRLGSFECGNNIDDCGAHSIGASLIARAPVGKHFALYGRLGLSRNSLDERYGSTVTSEDSNEVTLGFGGEVLFNKHFRLRGEFVNLGSNEIYGVKVKLTQFNVGLSYNF